MSEQVFVEATWGPKAVAKLDRIRRGGDSNEKGNRYETHFATYLFAKYKSEGMGGMVRISSQEYAWVDDLCVRIENEAKVNYQAKNSSGAAAAWDDEIEERFERQQTMDLGHHQAGQARQVLLVSCENRCSSNNRKIPGQMLSYASCEFFPFHDPAVHLLIGHSPVAEAFAEICGNRDFADMDVAFRALRSQWIDVPSGSPMLVDELIEKAKQETRPNVFKELDGPQPPDWLEEIIEPFADAAISAQSGGFVVRVRNTTVRLPGSIATKSKVEAIGELEVSGELQLIELLFRLSSESHL